MRDEDHKCKYSVLTTEMPWEVKIQTQYPNEREFIKEENWILFILSWPLFEFDNYFVRVESWRYSETVQISRN